MEIGILGELLKSFISDFGLEGRKILHKVDTVDHSSYGQLMLTLSQNVTYVTKFTFVVPILRTIPQSGFDIRPEMRGRSHIT